MSPQPPSNEPCKQDQTALEPDSVALCCPHCAWWAFAPNDELGPRDLQSSIEGHLRTSHPPSLR